MDLSNRWGYFLKRGQYLYQHAFTQILRHTNILSLKKLNLKYGCSLNGLVVCFIGEDMFPLCDHHHQRVIQWHQEIDPDTHMECRSVWDIKWE
jgi:hypothetical protein